MTAVSDSRSRSRWQWQILLAVACLGLGYLAADFEAASLQATVAQQQGTLSHALEENAHLKQKIAALEVQLSILDQNQNDAVIKELLTQQQALKQQLQLYQQVLNVDEAKRYLNIHTVAIRPLSEPNTYYMSLLLLQGRAIKSVISGDLEILIQGTNAGQPETYLLSDLLSQSLDIASENSALRYRYQYFLDLGYTFRLPDGFTPEKVTIESDVYQWKTKRERITKAYLWLEILDENTQVLDNDAR